MSTRATSIRDPDKNSTLSERSKSEESERYETCASDCERKSPRKKLLTKTRKASKPKLQEVETEDEEPDNRPRRGRPSKIKSGAPPENIARVSPDASNSSKRPSRERIKNRLLHDFFVFGTTKKKSIVPSKEPAPIAAKRKVGRPKGSLDKKKRKTGLRSLLEPFPKYMKYDIDSDDSQKSSRRVLRPRFSTDSKGTKQSSLSIEKKRVSQYENPLQHRPDSASTNKSQHSGVKEISTDEEEDDNGRLESSFLAKRILRSGKEYQTDYEGDDDEVSEAEAVDTSTIKIPAFPRSSTPSLVKRESPNDSPALEKPLTSFPLVHSSTSCSTEGSSSLESKSIELPTLEEQEEKVIHLVPIQQQEIIKTEGLKFIEGKEIKKERKDSEQKEAENQEDNNPQSEAFEEDERITCSRIKIEEHTVEPETPNIEQARKRKRMSSSEENNITGPGDRQHETMEQNDLGHVIVEDMKKEKKSTMKIGNNNAKEEIIESKMDQELPQFDGHIGPKSLNDDDNDSYAVNTGDSRPSTPQKIKKRGKFAVSHSADSKEPAFKKLVTTTPKCFAKPKRRQTSEPPDVNTNTGCVLHDNCLGLTTSFRICTKVAQIAKSTNTLIKKPVTRALIEVHKEADRKAEERKKAAFQEQKKTKESRIQKPKKHNQPVGRNLRARHIESGTTSPSRSPSRKKGRLQSYVSTSLDNTTEADTVSTEDGDGNKKKKLLRSNIIQKLASHKNGKVGPKLENLLTDEISQTDVRQNKSSSFRDFLNITENSLKLYGSLIEIRKEEASQEDPKQRLKNGRPHVFLKRNIKTETMTKKQMVDYKIGESKPLLFFKQNKKLAHKERTEKEKKVRIFGLQSILTNRVAPRSIVSMPVLYHQKYNYEKEKKYSLQQLFLAEKQPTIAKGAELLKKLSKITIEEPSVLLTPRTSRSSSNDEPEIRDCLDFFKLSALTIPGTRIAWTTVFVFFEIKGRLTHLKYMRGSEFPMYMNHSFFTTIDLVGDRPKTYDKMYVAVKVELSVNQDEEADKGGRSLRGRGVEEPKKKKLTLEDVRGVEYESVFWGAQCIFDKVKDAEENKWYKLGYMTIPLINERSLNMSRTQNCPSTGALLSSLKRLNENPFLQAAYERRPLTDTKESDFTSGSDSSDTESNDDRNSQRSERSIEDGNEEEPRVSCGIPPGTYLDAATGRFKFNKKGYYINDKEMIKYLFKNSIILHDKKKMDLIKKWMPMAFPPGIKYQFQYFGQKAHGRHIIKQCSSLNWDVLCHLVNEKETPVDRCIFCGKSFNNMFALMFHYNTNYPRFSFAFGFINDPFTKAEEEQHKMKLEMAKKKRTGTIYTKVQIGIFLNPEYDEQNEVLTVMVDPDRRKFKQYIPVKREVETKNLTRPSHAKGIRTLMRMDLTLYALRLNVPDIINESFRLCRHIDVYTGQPMKMEETRILCPRSVPQPGCSTLMQVSSEAIQDYTDICQETKDYMTAWNKLSYTIGRYNINSIGYYMLHRLFVKIYRLELKNNKDWKRLFHEQLLHNIDNGVISGDDMYDLLQRIKDDTYDPLKDPLGSLYRACVHQLKVKQRSINAAIKKKTMDINHVPKIFLTDIMKGHGSPNRKESKEQKERMDKVVSTMFLTRKTINRMDGRRLFAADEFTHLVKYAEENREELNTHFNRIEVELFNPLSKI